MITFFSIPKPFVGHIGVIQRNAIRSWKKAVPDCEIILFGDEEGIEEAAKELNVTQIKNIKKNDYGTPFLDTIFKQVNEIARFNAICYSNCDMIYSKEIASVVENCKYDNFLLVGRRKDVILTDEIDASKFDELLIKLRSEGRMNIVWAIDYFIFNKSLFSNIPPFLVGRAGWDNWMIFNARLRKVPVIDCTNDIEAFHQNHDHSHVKNSRGSFRGPESDYNLKLIKCQFFSLTDADYLMQKGVIIKAPQPVYRTLWYRLFLRPHLWEEIGPLMKCVWYEKILSDKIITKIKREVTK